MKRIKYFGILSVLICLMLSANVSAHTKANTYRHKTYNTRQEVETLEKTLVKDGYFNLSDDDALYNQLKDNEEFAYNYLLTDDNKPYYHIYLYPSDVEEYKNTGDLYLINSNAVLVDYYKYDYVLDEGNPTGKTGNEIPDDMKRGLLSLKGYIDKELLQNGVKDAVGSVILYEEESNQYFEFELNWDNDYYLSENIPVGHYYIYSAFLSEKYPASYDESLDMGQEGFVMNPSGVEEITLEFGTPMKKSELTASENTVSSSDMDEAPVQKDNKTLTIICFIFLLIVGIGIIAYLFYYLHYMKKANEEDDE